MAYDLIVVGTSWGGLDALSRLLEELPMELDLPIAIAQHRGPDTLRGGLEQLLQRHVTRPVCEAEDKQPIERCKIYLAPPDYHLLVEPGTFHLSVDERVSYSRPSIDVLFETAADAYGAGVIGVVLTGANEDGAAGVAAIVARGGVAIVQDPETAMRREMPDAAIGATDVTILPLEQIPRTIADLCCVGKAAAT